MELMKVLGEEFSQEAIEEALKEKEGKPVGEPPILPHRLRRWNGSSK